MDNSFERLAEAFLNETRAALDQEHRRIRHCFEQLTDAHVWYQHRPQVNSMGMLVIHLCGNLRQWFLHGVGGAEDSRKRMDEFETRIDLSKGDLLAMLASLLKEIDTLLQSLPAGALLHPRTIRGSDTHVLAAIYSTVNHMEGHAQQIVYMSHCLLGDKYEPFWKPEDPERG
jgi:hypothetical protein